MADRQPSVPRRKPKPPVAAGNPLYPNESVGEAAMDAALRERGIPFAREFRFHVPRGDEKQRQWRFDFYIEPLKLAIEVQGGIFTGGRHVRGPALIKEFEKVNAAAQQGIRIMYAVYKGREADICIVADQVAHEFNRTDWRHVAEDQQREWDALHADES